MAHHIKIQKEALGQPLSTAELNVYKELISDLTPEEIASRLYKARRTINFHTFNIYKKLGVKNRYGLIVAHYENQARKLTA